MNAAADRIRVGLAPAFLLFLGAGLLVGMATVASAQTDTGTAVEACISCHATGTLVPVSDINNPWDAHYVDLDPDGPESDAGYRQLDLTLTAVDVTGSVVIIDFSASDENGDPVTNLFDADGRFGIGRLEAGASFGDPTDWHRLLSSERFTTVGGIPITELLDMCIESGVKIIACQMTMDVMGVKREDLIDELDVGGAATFLEWASRCNITLFV